MHSPPCMHGTAQRGTEGAAWGTHRRHTESGQLGKRVKGSSTGRQRAGGRAPFAADPLHCARGQPTTALWHPSHVRNPNLHAQHLRAAALHAALRCSERDTFKKLALVHRFVHTQFPLCMPCNDRPLSIHTMPHPANPAPCARQRRPPLLCKPREVNRPRSPPGPASGSGQRQARRPHAPPPPAPTGGHRACHVTPRHTARHGTKEHSVVLQCSAGLPAAAAWHGPGSGDPALTLTAWR